MFGPREMLLSSEEPVVRQFLNAQGVGPIGMSEEKDADELAAEEGHGAAAAAADPAAARALQRPARAAASASRVTGAARTASPRRRARSSENMAMATVSSDADGLSWPTAFSLRSGPPGSCSRSGSTSDAGLVPPPVPAPGVHPAGVVHRVGDDRPDRPGRDPVRRGHRAAGRRPDQAVRRPVVHRLGRGARGRPRGGADRHRRC